MNPESGKKKKITSYEEFYDILREHGYDTEIIFTKAKGDATKIIFTQYFFFQIIKIFIEFLPF